MRGKDLANQFFCDIYGITPAYAGKSGNHNAERRPEWDHPRVCGEKIDHMAQYGPVLGSPPRMRGKVAVVRSKLKRAGITPAYAGKRAPPAAPWA